MVHIVRGLYTIMMLFNVHSSSWLCTVSQTSSRNNQPLVHDVQAARLTECGAQVEMPVVACAFPGEVVLEAHPLPMHMLLLFIRIMGALMAKMMAPLHNIPYTVCNVHKPIYIIYKSVLWLWLIIVQSTCRVSIGGCCEPATQP